MAVIFGSSKKKKIKKKSSRMARKIWGARLATAVVLFHSYVVVVCFVFSLRLWLPSIFFVARVKKKWQRWQAFKKS